MLKSVVRRLLSKLPPAVSLRLRAHRARLTGEPELRLLPDLILPGSIVVDVGCNYGVYTFWLAQRVGAAGKVIAIDALQRYTSYLEAATQQLPLPQVRVIHSALSDEPGLREIAIPLRAGAEVPSRATLRALRDDHGSESVPCARLDDLLAPDEHPVAFVKCDVEGHELPVLRGATKTLQRDCPILLVEIEQRYLNVDISEVLGWVTERDYCGWFLCAGSLAPLDDFSVEEHQRANGQLDTRSNYINNFLFVPRARSDLISLLERGSSLPHR